VTTLILGASAGLGRELARQFAARQHRLLLIARDAADLEAEAKHLRLVYGAEVEFVAADAADPVALTRLLSALACAPTIRNLCFPVGLTIEPDDGLLPAPETVALVNANLTSIMAVTALFLPAMLQADRGNIIGFGSVAAIRGRRANIVYAAAKRGLESYFESLRHRLAATGVEVQFYRLGYVATRMTYGKTLLFPAATPEAVARRVLRGLDRDIPLTHIPGFWAGIGAVVRALPWSLYRRLDF